MEKHKIGVIGAGAIAQACHIPGYAAAGNCELTAVADPEEQCLGALREKGWLFDREYRDYREMLRSEKLDAVSVCTPNALHAQMAIDCLRAGCDLLLEKPVALRLEDALAIRATAEKEGRRIMVGFSHRFNELNLAARAAVQSGKIGTPYMIRMRFAHSGPWPGWAKTDWFYRPELSGGGALLDMAVHALDLCQWYQGPIRSVSAVAATLRKPIEVDDNVVALLEFDGSCLGYVDCSWTSPSGFVGVEIMADRGSIRVDYGKSVATMSVGAQTPDGKIDIQDSTLASGYVKKPWEAEMEVFTAGLNTDQPFAPGIEEGIDTLRLVQAAYESSRSGRRILIER